MRQFVCVFTLGPKKVGATTLPTGHPLMDETLAPHPIKPALAPQGFEPRDSPDKHHGMNCKSMANVMPRPGHVSGLRSEMRTPPVVQMASPSTAQTKHPTVGLPRKERTSSGHGLCCICEHCRMANLRLARAGPA